MRLSSPKKRALMITAGLAGGSFIGLKNIASIKNPYISFTIIGLGNYKGKHKGFGVISIPYIRYDGYWGHLAAKYTLLGIVLQSPLYVAALYNILILQPDIVVFNGLTTMIPLLPWAKILRKKVVLSFRSWWDEDRFKIIKGGIQFIGKQVDLTFVNSDGTKKNLARIFPEKNILVIPHHADRIFFRRYNRQTLRKKSSLSQKFVVLFVGRIDEEKHTDFLLDLIERLGSQKDIMFLFIGEGTLKSRVLDLSKKLVSVKYLGFISNPKELAKIYTTADLVWSYADETYLARPAIEALACGTPIIVPSTPAIGEKIGKGMNRINTSLVPHDIGWIINLELAPVAKLIVQIKNLKLASGKRASSKRYARHHYYKNPNKILLRKLYSL